MLYRRIAEGWVMEQFDAKLAEEARVWDAAVRESGVKID
jgi:hypothetical protein